MFFDDIAKIPEIAQKTGAAVFVVPRNVAVEIPGALVLKPEGKSVISIEQVQDMIRLLAVKQVVEQYIIIRPAEAMSVESANAFLKNLEEPQDKVHFVLITDAPSALLPTILSRAQVYFYRTEANFQKIEADEKIKTMAKKMMTARASELVGLVEEISKKKEGTRAYAMEVVGVAIEMLYKSYFLTRKEAFLLKLQKFLKLYEALEKNGHIKLQIVGNLC